ncbi:prepilin peptidase [Candidatus Bathyarchaeota archaeon]|nr:prepilin peptidase [Candidatus Bathyarchaeota archaeon]
MDLFIPKAALSLIILIPSTILDIKTREVPDKFWVVGSIFSLAMTAVEVLTGELSVLSLAVSITVGSVLGLALFYMGFFGGADSKALMFLSLTIPKYPSWFRQMTVSTPIPVLTIFDNSLILSLCYPLAILALNLADLARGRNPFKGLQLKDPLSTAVLLLSTRRVSLETLRRKVGYYPAERPVEVDGDIVRQPIHFMKAEVDKEELMKELEPYAAKGLYADGVLATPTIPFITFIMIGVLLMPVGDLILTLVSILVPR